METQNSSATVMCNTHICIIDWHVLSMLSKVSQVLKKICFVNRLEFMGKISQSSVQHFIIAIEQKSTDSLQAIKFLMMKRSSSTPKRHLFRNNFVFIEREQKRVHESLKQPTNEARSEGKRDI